MHNPTTTGLPPDPMQTRGYGLEMLHCACQTVWNWNDPVLRNTFWRCYIPITGGASIRSSRREWPMLDGEMIIIPADCPVWGHADTAFSLYYSHFNTSIQLRRAAPRVLPRAPEARAQLDRAIAERSEHLLGVTMLSIIASALRSIPDEDVRGQHHDRRMDNAYRHMKEHINRRLSNRELAHFLHMSETSLLRMFRTHAGTSPQKEHLRLRLNHAAELLRTTEQSIDEIADACGFWDRNHFTRVFTREWQIPPARYRRSATEL